MILRERLESTANYLTAHLNATLPNNFMDGTDPAVDNSMRQFAEGMNSYGEAQPGERATVIFDNFKDTELAEYLNLCITEPGKDYADADFDDMTAHFARVAGFLTSAGLAGNWDMFEFVYGMVRNAKKGYNAPICYSELAFRQTEAISAAERICNAQAKLHTENAKGEIC